MVSLLDCIKRTPQVLENILEKRHDNFASLFSALEGRINELEEIVMVGSGTSNTSALSSRIFVEKVTGIKTSVVYPNDFCYNTYYYNPKALYLFTSQTGTSKVALKAQQKVRQMGYLTVGITESSETPIAKESQIFVDMGCGKEEYLTRTIGYCASIFIHMLIGLEVGRRKGFITGQEYDGYIEMAKKVPDSHRFITPRAMEWMDKYRRKMMRSHSIIFTGADMLYGVALEAAVKLWEIPQHASYGYELEEGIHGPNFGYNHSHCVVVLNDGKRENEKALALSRWLKDVYQNGFVIGSQVVDKSDFVIDLKGGDFSCLEFAPVIQVIAYRMAVDQGLDLFTPQDTSVMDSYFKTR